jgi:hypothetical protein
LGSAISPDVCWSRVGLNEFVCRDAGPLKRTACVRLFAPLGLSDAPKVPGQDGRVSWARYEGRALADITLQGEALFAVLEDYVRVRNPHFTDIRLEEATADEEYDASVPAGTRWYEVTYLADDT